MTAETLALTGPRILIGPQPTLVILVKQAGRADPNPASMYRQFWRDNDAYVQGGEMSVGRCSIPTDVVGWIETPGPPADLTMQDYITLAEQHGIDFNVPYVTVGAVVYPSSTGMTVIGDMTAFETAAGPRTFPTYSLQAHHSQWDHLHEWTHCQGFAGHANSYASGQDPGHFDPLIPVREYGDGHCYMGSTYARGPLDLWRRIQAGWTTALTIREAGTYPAPMIVRRAAQDAFYVEPNGTVRVLGVHLSTVVVTYDLEHYPIFDPTSGVAISMDAQGRVTVDPGNPDLSAPAGSFLEPAPGAVVGETFHVRLGAGDDRGIVWAWLTDQLGHWWPLGPDLQGTVTLPDGRYQLRADLYDAARNITSITSGHFTVGPVLDPRRCTVPGAVLVCPDPAHRLENRIRLVDTEGRPMAGREVNLEIYLSPFHWSDGFAKADRTFPVLYSDADGWVSFTVAAGGVGRCYLSTGGLFVPDRTGIPVLSADPDGSGVVDQADAVALTPEITYGRGPWGMDAVTRLTPCITQGHHGR